MVGAAKRMVNQDSFRETALSRNEVARRSSAAKRGHATRRRLAATRAQHPAEDLGPDSKLRGSDPVDGDIGRILARIRAHTEGRSA